MIIHIPPSGNDGLAALTWAPLLTPPQCEEIVREAHDDRWTRAQVNHYDSNEDSREESGEVDLRKRSAWNQPLAPLVGPGLFRQIAHFVEEVNRTVYHFDLRGITNEDPPMLLRYDAETKDFFHQHMDIGSGPASTRKLTFTVQLSSSDCYEGGDLVVRGKSPITRDIGTISIFPSFLDHCVEPVTHGLRYSIVGWIHGPAFR